MANALPPGPKYGRVHTTWRWLRQPYTFLDELRAELGETFTLRIAGLPPLVFFSDPETVKQIFADDGKAMHAGELNHSLKAFLGEHSVLMLDGPEHMRRRRLLLPPFHGERMQAYGQRMLDAADEIIDQWPLGVPFSVHRHMQAITVRVIVRAILGIEDRARIEEMSRTIAELLDVGSWPPLLLPFMQKDLGRFSPWGRFLEKRAKADAMLMDAIARRRRDGTKGRDDVLSLLLEARDDQGRAFTDEELHDELVTLLVAGHETTATGLAWALRWVLAAPDVERKLRAEVAAATLEGADAAPLGPERIARLELLDATAREALRLVPIVPIVGRVLKEPMTIGGWELPAGTGVICSIYLAQRRPSVWQRPDEFAPERFLGRKFSPNEFFPFGGGIRRCIGMAFALYEMKMVLARVVARTRLRLAAPDEIRVVRRSITMMPSEGLRVVLESRLGSPSTSERSERRGSSSPARPPPPAELRS